MPEEERKKYLDMVLPVVLNPERWIHLAEGHRVQQHFRGLRRRSH